MLFVSLHLDAGSKFSSQRLASGDVMVTLGTQDPGQHTTLVMEPQAAEAFYEFMAGVVAGLRFDAMEEVGKEPAKV